jgi:hypothetical protein
MPIPERLLREFGTDKCFDHTGSPLDPKMILVVSAFLGSAVVVECAHPSGFEKRAPVGFIQNTLSCGHSRFSRRHSW